MHPTWAATGHHPGTHKYPMCCRTPAVAQHGSQPAALRCPWGSSMQLCTGSPALTAIKPSAHQSFPMVTCWQGQASCAHAAATSKETASRGACTMPVACAHCVMLDGKRMDRTGGGWGTGRHSPTRMRMHTSSAMRAPGLSVADTT